MALSTLNDVTVDRDDVDRNVIVNVWRVEHPLKLF